MGFYGCRRVQVTRTFAGMVEAGCVSMWRQGVRAGWRPATTAAIGLGGMVCVGYATAQNPSASPAGLAAPFRVAIIVALTAAAVYAQRGNLRPRIGHLLGGAVLLSSLWLLNGARSSVPFSVGVLASVVTPPLLAYLMLAHPTGQLRRPVDRRFMYWSGGAFIAVVLASIEMTGQLPVRTPLVQCVPHCPANELSLGLTRTVPVIMRAAMVLAWLTLTLGTAVLLHRRGRTAPVALRPILAPVRVWATLTAACLTAFLVARAVGSGAAGAIGVAYVVSGVVLPLAILLGLVLERMFMGQALARLVRQFAATPAGDPQALIAETIGDPSLRMAYRRPESGLYVDSSGASVTVPDGRGERAVSWVRRDGRRVAAVIYDSDLGDQEPFIQALGAVAVIRLERARLEADLVVSTRELEASRARLIESADAERRRLERDLHDGVQQQLLGLRIKLDLAAEAFQQEPVAGRQLLDSVGCQMDELLQSVRSLARGIYPTILTERGLPDAIRSAARTSPVPVTVRTQGLGRYPEEVEVAIYFCCLEALQNVAKHAGPGVRATVHLWEDNGNVCFEVRDRGTGFDPAAVETGSGLTNMQDRVDAIGGRLTVSSAGGQGTAVEGSAPVAAPTWRAQASPARRAEAR